MAGPEAGPESTAEAAGESLRVTYCVIVAIRGAQEWNEPLPDWIGGIESEAVPDNAPDVVVRVRRCGVCAVQCVLAEYANEAPLYAAPAGERTFLPECTVIE